MQQTKQKYAQCDKYLLVKPLGSGYNSKVKLGFDSQNNSYAAVKMIKHSHPSLNLKTLKKEIEILQSLSHPNIVNLFDFQESADYVKKNGNSYKVVMIVMELVPNGELFEYVADSGRFSEKLARSYFKVLIETLEYCHNQGICHRDLKPENLLFDADFNLKVADFGFSTLLAGKDGSGQLTTILGTESYMAPEINMRQPYSGPSVDLFASAIILFILISGTPPFAKADPKADPHYKLLCVNRHETFWKAHERNKPKENGANFYSDSFKDLINSMLSLNPSDRPTINGIKNHEWFQGETMSFDEIKVEFVERKKKVDEELQRQREAKEKQKLQVKQNAYGGNAYGGIKAFRSAESDMRESLLKALEGKVDLEAKRELREYQGQNGFNPKTETMSVVDLDLLYMSICSIALEQFKDGKITFADDSYKLKVATKKDSGELSFNIILTKVDDSTTCVEFHKKDGNVMNFYTLIDEFRKALPKESNTEEKIETSSEVTESVDKKEVVA